MPLFFFTLTCGEFFALLLLLFTLFFFCSLFYSRSPFYWKRCFLPLLSTFLQGKACHSLPPPTTVVVHWIGVLIKQKKKEGTALRTWIAHIHLETRARHCLLLRCWYYVLVFLLFFFPISLSRLSNRWVHKCFFLLRFLFSFIVALYWRQLCLVFFFFLPLLFQACLPCGFSRRQKSMDARKTQEN